MTLNGYPPLANNPTRGHQPPIGSPCQHSVISTLLYRGVRLWLWEALPVRFGTLAAGIRTVDVICLVAGTECNVSEAIIWFLQGKGPRTHTTTSRSAYNRNWRTHDPWSTTLFPRLPCIYHSIPSWNGMVDTRRRHLYNWKWCDPRVRSLGSCRSSRECLHMIVSQTPAPHSRRLGRSERLYGARAWIHSSRFPHFRPFVPLLCLFVRPSIRLFVHSSLVPFFARSSVRPFVHSFVRPLIRPFVYSLFARSFRPFVHSFVRPSIRPFAHSSFVRSFVRPSALPFVHSFFRPSVWFPCRPFPGRADLIQLLELHHLVEDVVQDVLSVAAVCG